MADKIRNALRSFLKVEPPQRQTFTVHEELDFWANAFANKLWYRGSASELNQFYRQLDSDTCPFWGSVPTRGFEIRKIHTGLPKIIINTLVNIIIRDLNDIEYEDVTKNDIWKAVCDENKLNDLLTEATKDILVVGDGAMKIGLDPEISEYPILEWYPGDQVDFVYKRGRLCELVFRTKYTHKKHEYCLHEKYGYGYIRYELYDGDNQIELGRIPQTEGLTDLEFDKSFMMAVPYKMLQSDRWKGRGQSIFEGKIDNFDALDEAWSQWVHAMRASRPVKYIPDILIPRNEDNGKLMKPNAFDNQFVATESNMMEGARNEIEVKQPDFPAASYGETYMTALDLALQGLISPSTLGIDVKKMDNAEAQREKEKATLYTRGIMIEAMTGFLELLTDFVFKAYNTALKQSLTDTETLVTFGEYANPSFEAVVETLSNPNTPMSIEAKVDEMWGDSKDKTWKEQEVLRIKEQQGIVTLNEPAVDEEFTGGAFNV
jgi:hypothetical protein